MEYSEGNLEAIGNTTIHYRSWRPEQRPRAVIMIVHGLAEHGGRYMNLVNHFVPRGFSIYAPDLPGHGRSGGTRVYVDRFQDLLDPLSRCRDRIHETEGDLPVFLVGHSMGGLVVTLYLAREEKRFQGAVLSGPSIKIPPSVPRAKVIAARILSRIIPRAGIMPLDHDGMSRDPEVVRTYMEDPLVHTGNITARLGAEILGAMEQVPGLASGITLPLLILHGGADRVVAPESSILLHNLAGSRDKTLRILDGLYHEVFNEPEHPAVLLEMEDWMGTRLEADS